MKQELTHSFELIEERTQSNGFKVRVYEGIGYELVWRQYSTLGIDIRVTPDKSASRFIPYIYVHTDDEGRPDRVSIETTAYGSLSIKEYGELQRAMALAICSAEEIKARFIPHEEEVSK